MMENKEKTVNGNAEKYQSIDGVLFSADLKTLLSYPKERKDKRYDVPDRVEKIDDEAFIDCKYLETITVPDCLTTIGRRAFMNCSSLKYISLGKYLHRIDAHAFRDCAALKTIEIPENAELSQGVFGGHTSLQSIKCDSSRYKLINGGLYSADLKKLICAIGDTSEFTVLPSTKIIGLAAFENRNFLTTVFVPDTLEKIGYNAFRGCHSLSRFVIQEDGASRLPKALVKIDGCAFKDCDKLQRFHIPVTLMGDMMILRGRVDPFGNLVY